MKAVYLFALPALLLSHATSAQQFRLGVKGGLNYAGSAVHTIVGSDRLLGINGGVVVRHSFTPDEVWNVQAELLYSGRGDKNKNGYTSTGSRTTHIYRRNYLELPIVGKIKAHRVTLEAGPQLGYLLSVHSSSGNFYDLNGRLQSYKSFKPLQLGYVVGLGYELPAGFSLTLRYSRDFTNIYKVEFSDATNLHNSMFQGQLGYLFGPKQ